MSHAAPRDRLPFAMNRRHLAVVTAQAAQAAQAALAALAPVASAVRVHLRGGASRPEERRPQPFTPLPYDFSF